MRITDLYVDLDPMDEIALTHFADSGRVRLDLGNGRANSVAVSIPAGVAARLAVALIEALPDYRDAFARTLDGVEVKTDAKAVSA